MVFLKISEAALKALKELGLTEYEVQAYVALVDGGQMPASDISTISKVPYSRIYDVLGRLEQKGFIQIQRGRPTLYVAKAPTEVVRLVKLAWDERLEKSCQVITNELQARFEHETQATTRDVWILHGRAAILAKAFEMLDGAREEVMLSFPTMDLGRIMDDSDFEGFSAIIEKIIELKTPKVQVLTSAVPDDLKNIIPSSIDIRTRDKVFGAGLVVDRHQTLIMLAGADAEGTFLGIFSSHMVFADMAYSYFTSLFDESNPI